MRYALLVICLCTGCGAGGESASRRVDLFPPSTTVATAPTILTVSIPAGMSVARTLPIRSRFDTALTNLRTASSCGCTSAELDKAVIAPQEMATLRCVFDGGTTAEVRGVRIMLYSPDIPSGPFVLNMQLVTDPSQSGYQIASSPNKIMVNERLQRQHVREHVCSLMFGEKVRRDAVVVTTSSPSISARLQSDSLTIGIDATTVGQINEHVIVAFPLLDDTYSLKIPIEGNILPPIEVSPKFINFGQVEPEDDMRGDVLLEGTGSDLDKPDILVTGDWKIQALERINERSWKLSVCLNSLEGNAIRYGNILVKGNWPGERINIPLTGGYAKRLKSSNKS